MKSLLPLFPFVAALGLLACQGDDGPVAEGAAPGDEVVGDATASGLATAPTPPPPRPPTAPPCRARADGMALDQRRRRQAPLSARAARARC